MHMYLVKRDINDIWTFEGVVSILVCLKLMTINQVATSNDMRRLLKNEFNSQIKNFNHVRQIIMNHAEEIVCIIADQVKKEMEKFKPVISFDEWTTPTGKQMMNIIIHLGQNSFNAGLITIKSSSTAENLKDSIFAKLQQFGIHKEDVKYLIADGASVNKKISRIMDVPIQQCINHGIQLAIVDTFYSFQKTHQNEEEFSISPNESDDDREEQIDCIVDDEEIDYIVNDVCLVVHFIICILW